MKKLIAIAVVFALAAGMGFAADLGVNVIGTVSLFGSNTNTGSKITGGGALDRIRLEGAGENDDGTFGAWWRFEPGNGQQYNGDIGVSGLAWWKPIDQVKVSIGGNPDGIFGKEGYAGWMFHQIVADTGVVNASQAWGTPAYTIGGPPWANSLGWASVFRNAFYGGYDNFGLLLEIKPVDMFGLNIVLPYIQMDGSEVAAIFKNMKIQVDLNLDFGNIALTYNMGTFTSGTDTKIGGRMFLYFGLNSIENLSLDFGVGFGLPRSYLGGAKAMDPMSIGLAAKYSISDSFGIKARVLAEFMGSTTAYSGASKDPIPFNLVFELNPFFSINDNVTIFVDLGISMRGADKNAAGVEVAKSIFGWHFNPYVQIGNEWGPSFFAGFQLYSRGDIKKTGSDSALINWSVPIALNVSF